MHAYRPNHYEVLGVPRSADAEAIRTAYRARAKQLHPDLSEGGESESNEAFLHLQEAYDVLRDPQRRAHYDDTLARQVAIEQAARWAARRPIRPNTVLHTAPKAPAATPPTPSSPIPSSPWRGRPRRILGLRRYLAAIGLVVIVTAGIVSWPLFFPPELQPIMIVKVDRDDGGRPGRGGGGPASSGAPELPPDPGILTKEVDRIVQAHVERVEAARKRMEAQLSELEARKPPPNSGSPDKTPTLLVSRVECIGRGTNIVLTRDKDIAKVSYDNGPEVQPRIREVGTGTILVSRIEPTNKIAIAFTKGDRNGTTLLMFDQAGSVQQTFNIGCTVAAF
jgi:hypothetical protein